MRESKWGILALQETHESEEAAATLERTNPRVWAFPNPGTRFSAGTIFLLYKDFFPNQNVTRDQIEHHILVPGRAQMLRVPWREGENIDLVNIYAPNDPTEAIAFFATIKRKSRRHPDILMGDFNHVENFIDRIPQRESALNMQEALADLRRGLGLTDGWRLDNPGTHAYTWTSASSNIDGITYRSRLDRILTSKSMTERTARWRHQTSQGISDHDFAYIDIIDERDPEMGTSRWRMSEGELNDEYLEHETLLILRKAQSQMRQGKDTMVAWLKMKASIKKVFMTKKTQLTKLRSAKMANLENDRDKAKAHPDYATNTQIQRNCEAIEQQIQSIKQHKTESAVLTQTARYRTLGESVSKYWFSIGKSLMTESMIRSLKDEEGIPCPHTDDMLEIAAKHHETLMRCLEMTAERQHALAKIVSMAKETPLSPANAERLGSALTEVDAELAIRVSQTGKAPGEDGIPYEFYKKWEDKYKKRTPNTPEIPSIVQMMVKAWNAPSRKTAAQTEYVKGLMALLYKKGDKELPANYRPITLLNTDEKLETKCLATRMGLILPSIIHPDQAGFVPGRDILDQVKLAKVIAEYCEVTEQNGCLIALDQEKAYDRIDHSYQWEILAAYGVPGSFIQRIQALYANATTQVMINRKLSCSFPVNRGVRQGDPMSCLLFDLAIEPLAESLRRSTLHGIRIPGQAGRIICKLFADDTQLYLAKHDSPREAMGLAENWTIASTAKFNKGKTEVLPLGKQSFRNRVVATRRVAGKITPNDDPLPVGARVIKTGKSLRILGRRVGYKLDIDEIWDPIINKMEVAVKKWATRPITMKGKAIVASFLVLSLAQYPIMVNEPSKAICQRINQTLRKLVWKGKARGILKLETLANPIGKGGIGLPLVEAKARAARIMWLKKWRKSHATRPQWTIFLERMLRKNAKGTETPWMKSILDQTWQTRKMRLTKETRNLIKEADTSNLKIDALKMGKRHKLEMLIWRTSNSNVTAKLENSAEARRLWNRHAVNTQAGLIRVRNMRDTRCKDHEKCIQAAEKWMLGLKPKVNILDETPKNRRSGLKDGLDLTFRRKEANVINRRLGQPVILDPSVTHNEARTEASRVFGPTTAPDPEIAYRQTNLNVAAGTTVVYTDGSADKNGYDNSSCGAGLWSTTQGLSGSYKIPGYPPSHNRGELAAVTLALEKAPINRRLLLRTDSTYTMSFLDGGYVKEEDRGWLDTPNADLMQCCLYLLRRRTAETLIQKVKAHSGDPGNEAADEATKAALALPEHHDLDLTVPEKWSLKGAKLVKLTFHDAYLWAKTSLQQTPSERAQENLTRFANYVESASGNRPSHDAIWASLRNPTIRKEVSDFLWQAVHGRTVCGPYFRHWGGEWTERQFCRCGALETLEHILTGCQEREWRAALWEEFRKIAGHAEATGRRQPLAPQFDDIMTIGLTKRKKTNPR